jgi:hypothetical protein
VSLQSDIQLVSDYFTNHVIALQLTKLDFHGFVENKVRKMLARCITEVLLYFRASTPARRTVKFRPALNTTTVRPSRTWVTTPRNTTAFAGAMETTNESKVISMLASFILVTRS